MVREEFVTIESDVKLKGTLTLPEQANNASSVPVVLMLHGSGPVDRDENYKWMKMNVFKELTEYIVPHGFATLRYDKRGVGESEGDYFKAGFWDLVKDAEASVRFLKTNAQIDADRIFLLGHSEGCTIAAALNRRESVRGIIFVAGAAESIKTTVLRQGEAMASDFREMTGFKGLLFRLLKVPDKIDKQQKSLIKRVNESAEPVLRIKGQKVNAKWMREHFAYNVIDDLEQITCPVLAVTGSKDVQVLPEHAKLFAEKVNGEAEYVIVDGMNHLLRKQSNPPSYLTLKKDYKESIKKPLDTELVNLITSWLEKQIG